MNVSELLETIEAKIGLMACQPEDEGLRGVRREIMSHLAEIRETLGVSCMTTTCWGCDTPLFHPCAECGGDFCGDCGDYIEGNFICGACQDDWDVVDGGSEPEADELEAVNPTGAAATKDESPLPYPDRYQRTSLAVQRAYHELRGKGYECYADLLCCQTCALSVIDGQKYVYWHAQDAALFVKHGTLTLGWGGDGDEIVEALRATGLEVEWPGVRNRRIAVRLRCQGDREVAA